MNTKKKITIRYKIDEHIEVKYRILDRFTDNVIALSPTYEDAKVLIKILNRQYRAKDHIAMFKKELNGQEGLNEY